MLQTLHLHPKVEKTLEQMKALGNARKFGAERAETIIDTLRNGAVMARAGRLSKSKDGRIKRLFKYDLGKGFRLICLKEKSALYVLFVGSHDRCDTWLENYSKKKPHQAEVPMTCYHIKQEKQSRTASGSHSIAEPEDDDMYDRMSRISQKELRKVFSGLVQSVQGQ